MENIRLNIQTGFTSTIYIRESFDELFTILDKESCVVVVIDKNVDGYYGGLFDRFRKIVLDVSEETKTLQTVDVVIENLLDMEVGRDALLLAVGGGVTTDITGFVASIYKRGVKTAYVATSLLGQVDASFGGKTGVNHSSYKNIVGTFSQPQFSYLNTSALMTLPKREFISGMVEMIKAFVISDRSSYQTMVDLFSKESSYDELIKEISNNEIFAKLLSSAIRMKCRIVEIDERENGMRRFLNLGHTFGHAIEKCAKGENVVLHGEAVAIGMIIAAEISCRMNLMEWTELDKLKNDFSKMGFPTTTDIPIERLIEAIRNDKKRDGEILHFPLLKNIGSTVVKDIDINELKSLLV